MKKFFSFAALLCACVLMLSSCGNAMDGVKQVADMTNSLCPMDQGNGVVINKVELSGSDLVYTCEVDEEVVDLDNELEARRQAAIASLKADADVVNLFKSAKVNIVYVLVGSESGETVKFTITPDEL